MVDGGEEDVCSLMHTSASVPLHGFEVVGILTPGDLLAAFARQEHRPAVAEVMQRDFLVADASDMIDVAFQRLRGHLSYHPRRPAGALVGLLTMDNVGEFLSVEAA